MPVNINGAMTRRKFLKISGAATAAATIGGTRVLNALVHAAGIADALKKAQGGGPRKCRAGA